MVSLAVSAAVRVTETHFCAFGSPWKKPTRLMFIWADPTTVELRCNGHRRCEFSGEPHVFLTGRDETGCFMTKKAEKYPWRFCAALVKVLANARLALQANKLGSVCSGLQQ